MKNYMSLVEKCDNRGDNKKSYSIIVLMFCVLYSLVNVNLNLTFMIQNVKVKNINENGKKDI